MTNNDRLLWPNRQQPLQRHRPCQWPRHIYGALSMHRRALFTVRIAQHACGCPSTPTILLTFEFYLPDFKKAFDMFQIYISTDVLQFWKESAGRMVRSFRLLCPSFLFPTLLCILFWYYSAKYEVHLGFQKKLLLCFKFLCTSTDVMQFQKENSGHTVRSYWLLRLSFIFQPFFILFNYCIQCFQKNMRCVLFILLFYLLSCFLLLALLLFRNERQSGTGGVSAGQDRTRQDGAVQGTEPQKAEWEGLCVRDGRRETTCCGTNDGAGQGGTVGTRGGVANEGRSGAGQASGRGRAHRDGQTKKIFLRSRKYVDIISQVVECLLLIAKQVSATL